MPKRIAHNRCDGFAATFRWDFVRCCNRIFHFFVLIVCVRALLFLSLRNTQLNWILTRTMASQSNCNSALWPCSCRQCTKIVMQLSETVDELAVEESRTLYRLLYGDQWARRNKYEEEDEQKSLPGKRFFFSILQASTHRIKSIG